MPDTAQLIADLEAAVAGTRELSDRVLLACGWEDIGAGYWTAPPPTPAMVDARYRPDPTRSIDDAVALVPEGWTVTITQAMNGKWWDAELCSLDESRADVETDSGVATPALALCIAILKAKADE